ncbi:DJC28-like protein, partial [Mya arenaria]
MSHFPCIACGNNVRRNQHGIQKTLYSIVTYCLYIDVHMFDSRCHLSQISYATAARDAFKEAYFKLAREYHPDSKSSTADARKFNQVKEAYKAIKSKLNAENGSKHSVYNDDDDDDDDSFKRQQPQHRQAQQNVYKYKLKQKMMTSDSPDDNALVQKDKKYARSKKMTRLHQ